MTVNPSPSVWLGISPSILRLTRWLLAATALTLFVIAILAISRSDLRAPKSTVLLRDRYGRFLGEAGAGNPDGEFGYWPVTAIPPRVAAAMLAIEDRRFYAHPGIDPLAIARAARQNARASERVSGASTIAMQVARMQDPGSRSWPRKLVEAATAVCLTARHGRQALLAHYLTIVPYGNRIHGIRYAARRYLDKPVEDLSWAEIAFLSAIPQAPGRMNPFDPRGRVAAIKRGRRILDLLHGKGVLSRDERDLAWRQIAALAVPPAGERTEEALHAVLRLAHDSDSWTGTKREVVQTTLDLDLQALVAREMASAIDAWEAEGARNAAVIVIDRQTAEVLAWGGSTGYFDEVHDGAIDYTSVSRSPGSTLKPFLVAHALDRGVIQSSTILDDIERGPGGIGNADDAFLGPMLPRTALANSRNVPAAQLVARLGVDETYGYLRELKLHDGRESARRYGLGLAIGGLPTTLERLVRAYTALARDGRMAELRWRLDDAPAEKRVMSEEAARLVTLFLSDPQARLPTFPRAGVLEYPFAAAVKTGTSSRFRDAWAVAWTSRHLVGAWVGDPSFRPMNRLTGYRSAAELVRSVLSRLHEEGRDVVAFPPPRGFHPLRLCALTGTRATDACDRVVVEWVRPGEEPMDTCRAHVQIAVDLRSGKPATRRTPLRYVELRTYLELPARYASWAEARRLITPPRPDQLSSNDGPVRITVTSPTAGTSILRDPETPPSQATLALAAIVDPPAAQIVWYVDGKPWRIVDHPYTTRWPLVPGQHVFQARVPRAMASSVAVEVTVE